MSVSTEKVTLQVTFPKEKLEALRFYMNEKDLTVEGELQKHIKDIYDKYVPSATRRYLERNDNEQEIQAEVAVTTNESTAETTARDPSTRGRRRTERAQNAQEQMATETTTGEENEETQEQTQEQTEEENQGMSMSM